MHPFKTITGQRTRNCFKLIMNYFLELNERPYSIVPETKGYLKIRDRAGRGEKEQTGCYTVGNGHSEPQLH